MLELFIYFSMIFAGIADDFYLQGILSKLKQKKWWEKKYPQMLYKNDYKIALFIHSFSYTFMIQLPPTILFLIVGKEMSILWYLVITIFNVMSHYNIDNEKANEYKINLITDQVIHLLQITLTYLLFLSFYI